MTEQRSWASSSCFDSLRWARKGKESVGWRVLAHIPARHRRRAGNAAGVSAPPEPGWPRIPDPNTSAPGRLENRGRSASASHRLPVRAGFLHKTQPSRAAARRQRPLGPGRDSGSSLPPRALRPLPHSPGGKLMGRDRAGSSWCCTPSPNTPNSTPGASQGIFGTFTMKKKVVRSQGGSVPLLHPARAPQQCRPLSWLRSRVAQTSSRGLCGRSQPGQ